MSLLCEVTVSPDSMLLDEENDLPFILAVSTPIKTPATAITMRKDAIISTRFRRGTADVMVDAFCWYVSPFSI